MSRENDAPGQRRRVRERIGALVLEFCRARERHHPPDFHVTELQRYVEKRLRSAPASADRILRQLRQEGKIDYEVTNRRRSLYRLIVKEPPSFGWD